MLLLRRALLAACVAALAVLLWRAAGVSGELARDREASRTYQYGLELLAAGEYRGASRAFRAVLVLSPRAVEAYGPLAEAEVRQRHYETAIAVYQRWLAIYPYTYVAALYREVAVIELRAGRPGDAKRDLTRSTALDPSDWHAWHLLGHAHLRLGEIAAAGGAWRQVIRLNPQFQPARDQLRRLGD